MSANCANYAHSFIIRSIRLIRRLEQFILFCVANAIISAFFQPKQNVFLSCFCYLRFAFCLFIYKKAQNSCSIQKLFVILRRFCMVRTLHWRKNMRRMWIKAGEIVL